MRNETVRAPTDDLNVRSILYYYHNQFLIDCIILLCAIDLINYLSSIELIAINYIIFEQLSIIIYYIVTSSAWYIRITYVPWWSISETICLTVVASVAWPNMSKIVLMLSHVILPFFSVSNVSKPFLKTNDEKPY